MKQSAASDYRDEEGKEAVRKGIATGCGETALIDQQEGVNPYCNKRKQQIHPQNPSTSIRNSETQGRRDCGDHLI